MSCKISRRSFLKVSGCLMLGSAVSGLLCGAGDPAEGGAAVPTVGGLRVNYVRAFAKDYGNNFRQMEIHLNIENTIPLRPISIKKTLFPCSETAVTAESLPLPA